MFFNDEDGNNQGKENVNNDFDGYSKILELAKQIEDLKKLNKQLRAQINFSKNKKTSLTTIEEEQEF